jgi:Dockerin type I domain
MSADNNADTTSVVLDPTTTVEPIVPSAVAPGINFTMSAISTISVFGNATGIRPAFDDLRVGTLYTDVLPPLPLPGDTNGDNLVDMLDYQAIISHMNLNGQPLGNGDVTGDGRVTIADYRLWKDRRTDLTAGAGGGTGSGPAVPEPSGMVLLLIGVFASLAAVRKKLTANNNPY